MTDKVLVYVIVALAVAVIVRVIIVMMKGSSSKGRRVAVLADVVGAIQSPNLNRGKVAHRIEVKFKHPRTQVIKTGYSEEITEVPNPLPEKVRVYVDLKDDSNYTVDLKKIKSDR